MNLSDQLKDQNIFIADCYQTTDAFYADFANFLKKIGHINDPEKIKRLFIKRESVQSTAIGKGAAAPHIFSPEFKEFTICIALIQEGMDFKAPDGQPVFLVFLIMSDDREVGLHLKSLAHIARLVSSTDIVAKVKTAADARTVRELILTQDRLI